LAFFICESQIRLPLRRSGHLLANLCSAWVVLDIGCVVDREASRISIVGTVLGAGGVIRRAMEVEFLARISVVNIDVTAVKVVDGVLNGPLHARLVTRFYQSKVLAAKERIYLRYVL
jgi:hypothetical protein